MGKVWAKPLNNYHARHAKKVDTRPSKGRGPSALIRVLLENMEILPVEQRRMRHAQILAQRGSGAREVVSGMYAPRENMDPTQNKPTNTTRVCSAQPVTTVMAKL